MIGQNKKILSSLVLILISIAATAQSAVGGGEGPPTPGGGPGPPGAPIDDGLLILCIIGVIYGIYRILKHPRKLT